jgi:GAF domain-containing protein
MSRAAQLRAAIRRLNEALAAPLSASDVQQIIVEEAQRLTDAASAALCLLAPDREMLDFAAAAGENAEEIVGLRVRVVDSLAETVLASGEPILFPEAKGERQKTKVENKEQGTASQTPENLSPFAFRLSPNAYSAAIVPVLKDGRILGALAAMNKAGDASADTSVPLFNSEDIANLTLLAESVTIARKVEKTARTAHQQARELAVLYDAARTVAGSLNVQQVLDSVLTAICAHLEYHTAVLFLLNDEHTHLFIATERGLNDDERDIQLPADRGLPARVLDTGLPRLLSDTDQEPDFEDLSDRARALSAMFAPVRSRDETHGIVLITSLQRHAYQPEDLQLLAAVGMQAGIAIENAWLYEDAQRQAEQATALYDLSQHVNATLHLDRVLNFVADSVLNLLHVDKFALLLYDRNEERLVPRLGRGVDEEKLAEIRPRVGEGIAGWVYEWQTPQAVSDVPADARNRTSPLHTLGVASTLCVPMQVGEDVIGVIHAMNSRRRLFTVAEMELLYTIANQAAVAIFNATLYQDARAKSHEMRRYFRRVAHAIGSALDAQDMPQLLADLAIEIMRADRCALYRVEGEELLLMATSHFRPAVPPDERIPVGQGLAGWIARRGQSLVLFDLAADPRSRIHSWLHRDRLASYLAIPLKAGRRTVGVLEIYSSEPRDFRKEEVQLLATFAQRAKLAQKMALEAV